MYQPLEINTLKKSYFLNFLFNFLINDSGHYRMVDWQFHTPNDAVIHVTHVMNLVDELRALVLAAQVHYH